MNRAESLASIYQAPLHGRRSIARRLIAGRSARKQTTPSKNLTHTRSVTACWLNRTAALFPTFGQSLDLYGLDAGVCVLRAKSDDLAAAQTPHP